MRCTDVEVPIDYDNPAGARATIRVKQLVSAGEDAPALFLNPGGPGGSGVQTMDYVTHMTTEELRAAYNVTGFDPRGVNESSPAVSCFTDAERDADRAKDMPTETDADLDALAASVREYGKQCAEKTGEILNFVDTRSAARDLDVLRAVVASSETLDYLGFSYGTYLGATYAELFPKNTGHLVLDGAIDPTTSLHEVSLGQAKGFDRAIRAYVEDCQAGADCPLRGDVDAGIDQLDRFFRSLGTNPLPTSDPDRPLTRPLGFMGVITPLYSQESWPQLTMALDQAMSEGDGSMLLFMADLMADRESDGTYSTNSDEAFTAINCLDFQPSGDREQWRADVQELAEASALFGPELGYGDLMCEAWPAKARYERGELHAVGSAPILVIGTMGDPATPYEWSEALADQLENGYLLTYEGEGHTAYSATNGCVADFVDAFFLDDELPEADATCEDRGAW